MSMRPLHAAALLIATWLPLAGCAEEDKEESTDTEPDTDDGDEDEDEDEDEDTDVDDDTDDDDTGSVVNADEDGDGYSELEGDCDDGDPDVHPGAPETCNDVDDDCNGDVDDVPEGTEGLSTWYRDEDGDGWGSDDHPTVEACSEPYLSAARGGDCDDYRAGTHPDAEEIDYNGRDENCDSIDVDMDACLAALNSPTLYADDPIQSYRVHGPYLYETYVESGTTVARWGTDDGHVRIMVHGMELTPTSTPLTYDMTLTTVWEVGTASDPFEFSSQTGSSAGDQGYSDAELTFTCAGSLSRDVVFTGEVTIRGWSTLDYEISARMISLTAAPLSWSDFTFLMTYVPSWDFSAEGCTQANADMLAAGAGYADFADIYTVLFDDRDSSYLSDVPRSSGVRRPIEDACPQP